ncbi:MAG: hypothetical protein ACE5KV_09645 [Thermoplasmata archaeon]
MTVCLFSGRSDRQQTEANITSGGSDDAPTSVTMFKGSTLISTEPGRMGFGLPRLSVHLALEWYTDENPQEDKSRIEVGKTGV